MIGPVSYTVGHGDGDKLRSNAASDDVGAHGGSAEECWAPALVHNSRSRSIIALHPEIRGPA